MQNLRLVIALLTPLLNVAVAGSVAMYTCGAGENDPYQNTGSSAVMAMRVHYSYDENECPSSKKRSWDAFTGTIPALLGFKEFCGGKDGDGNEYSKDFCGNINILGGAGLHVKLHGHDVAVGASDSNVDILALDSDYAADLCNDLGISDDLSSAQVSSWGHVSKTTCV